MRTAIGVLCDLIRSSFLWSLCIAGTFAWSFCVIWSRWSGPRPIALFDSCVCHTDTFDHPALSSSGVSKIAKQFAASDGSLPSVLLVPSASCPGLMAF